MFKSLFAICRYFCYWLIFFFIERLIFLLYFFNKVKECTTAEIAKVLLNGLWMDVSMAAYVCALPLLCFIVFLFAPEIFRKKKGLRIYTLFFSFLFLLIAVINLNIYYEWGSKISYKAIEYAVRFPKEAFAASSSSPILLPFIILVLAFYTAVLLYKKITVFIQPVRSKIILRIAVSAALIGLEITAIRGGLQLAPMNESMAYFSVKPFLNYAAVNTEWSFVNDILKNKLDKYGDQNPYQYFPQSTADSIVHNLYATATQPAANILAVQKPNVVIIIIESFTAGVIASLGGEKGITPNMEQLIGQGVLFTNAFAAGDRTDKGTIAVLSGFPAQAVMSIIKNDSKQKQLPSIAQALAKKGYHTSFYYGGESEFVNTKSYLLSHAYTRLIDKNNFDKKDMNSKWGAYDEVVFNRQLQDMNTEPQPFFSTVLTLTNHEPFELPAAPHFGNTNVADMFRSTAWYTDSCLGDYMRKAAQQPWFKNTLFVLVADHGHLLPADKYDINDYHRFQIPLLFFGGAVKPSWRGVKINSVASQTDIAATLLGQLAINASAFTWSKNLLNPAAKPFAFYNWDNGFGFASPQQIISFDNVGKHITFTKNNTTNKVNDSLLQFGKACMQTVYNQYLKY